jgi:hypothetical protein
VGLLEAIVLGWWLTLIYDVFKCDCKDDRVEKLERERREQ